MSGFIISKLIIDGFWGDKKHKIRIDFNQDINFIIGVNGSGKTTLINLLAAALQGDIYKLMSSEFQKIEIHLKNSKEKILKYERKDDALVSSLNGKNLLEIPIDKIERYSIRKMSIGRIVRSSQQERMFLKREIEEFKRHNEFDDQLKDIKVSWLSIHRANLEDLSDRDSMRPPIDIKLQNVAEGLLKLFSGFDTKIADEHKDFQEKVFLAFLSGNDSSSSKQKNQNKKNSDEITEIKRNIEEILAVLSVGKEKIKGRVDAHFRALENDQNDPFAARVLTEILEPIIVDWKKYNNKKEEILKPKENFIKKLNDLFQRKTVTINERNEIKVTTQSRKNLNVTELSSGEKQLLIIFGEALLQEGQTWIYISDEPELSLHVKWQENLVRDVNELNPNAQIIFATHSPDIVSVYHDKVFDMEKILDA